MPAGVFIDYVAARTSSAKAKGATHALLVHMVDSTIKNYVALPIAADLAYPSAATAAYPEPQRIAQSIAADLAKVGIVARLRAVDPVAIRDAKATLTLDTTPVGLDPDDVFWPLFGDQDLTDTSLVVGLLRKARTEADPSKRAELWRFIHGLGITHVGTAAAKDLDIRFGGLDAQDSVNAFFEGKTGMQLVSSSENGQIQALAQRTGVPIGVFAFPSAHPGRLAPAPRNPSR